MSSGQPFNDLIIDDGGGTPLTMALSDDLDVNGNLTITDGTLDAWDGITSFDVTVAGNWTNNDTFTARTGTVTLDGTSQAINGSATFYNLTKSVASADTLTFQESQTTTIATGGTVTLNGASGQLLSLVSSSPGTNWNFNVAAGCDQGY